MVLIQLSRAQASLCNYISLSRIVFYFVHSQCLEKKLRSSFVISMYHGTMAGIKDSKYVYAKERKNYMKNVHIMYLKNSNKKRKIWKSRWQNEIFEEKKIGNVFSMCWSFKDHRSAASPMRSSENDNKGTNTCKICFPIYILTVPLWTAHMQYTASAGTLREVYKNLYTRTVGDCKGKYTTKLFEINLFACLSIRKKNISI